MWIAIVFLSNATQAYLGLLNLQLGFGPHRRHVFLLPRITIVSTYPHWPGPGALTCVRTTTIDKDWKTRSGCDIDCIGVEDGFVALGQAHGVVQQSKMLGDGTKCETDNSHSSTYRRIPLCS